MARILFGNTPLSGRIAPTIAVAQTLIEMGHTVGYVCHPITKSLFQEAGIPFLDDFHWGEVFVYISKNLTTMKPHKLWWYLIKEKKVSPLLYYFHELEEYIPCFLRLIDKWNPDVCVFDEYFYPGIIAAEICQIPYAINCPRTLPLPSKALLPYGFGFPSSQKSMSWQQQLACKLTELNEKKNTQRWNQVRLKYNLPPVNHVFALSSPYLYLVYTTDVYDFKRPDLLPQVYYVGPSISPRRGNEETDFPWHWLNNSHVIYFSMGTIFSKKKIIDKVIKASTGMPWKLVISISKNLQKEKWGSLPENVRLFNYVPQVALLKRVEAVISHGGHNTVTETLSAGLPLVVIPQFHDQFDSAQRVLESGAGLRLDPKQLTAESLRRAIVELYNEPTYCQNAERVANDYARCNGPKTAALLILKLAERHKPLLRPHNLTPTVYAADIEKVLNTI